jgi:hypothetical protein
MCECEDVSSVVIDDDADQGAASPNSRRGLTLTPAAAGYDYDAGQPGREPFPTSVGVAMDIQTRGFVQSVCHSCNERVGKTNILFLSKYSS